jgi:hypothetical protein
MLASEAQRANRGSRAAWAALLALAVACGGAGARSAPAPQRASSDTSGAAFARAGGCPVADSAALANADIAVVADVRAQSVRFGSAPKTHVSFPGAGARDTLSCTDRENLPRPVRPGVTYRNVRVRGRIVTVFDTARTQPGDTARPAPR